MNKAPDNFAMDFTGLPGADMVLSGISDVLAGRRTEWALLVLLAGPRLRGLGIVVPEAKGIARPYEHALYGLLEETHGDGAYSRYNSLIRRIVSFARALEHRNRWEDSRDPSAFKSSD